MFERKSGWLATSALVLAYWACGCSAPSGGTGGTNNDGNDGGDGGTGDPTAMRVSFDAEGGNFAIGEDDEGNQYSFRSRETEDGDTVISEARVVTEDGTSLVVSLDENGLPVNFRSDDNSNADVVYDGDEARVRYTNESGEVSDVTGVDAAAARALVADRTARNQSKRDRMLQDADEDTTTLVEGFEDYEVAVESMFDDSLNGDSPLAEARWKRAALLLGRIASQFDIEPVDDSELEDVVIDEVPDAIKRLAGQTFVLFDAEGVCVQEIGAANRLSFDNNGVLQSEFDRYFVFPDFSTGGSSDPGVTINYSTGTPVNLTPNSEVGFELIVTPVFTGSSLDENGHITVERRFQSDMTFTTDVGFGGTTATAQQLFDAAFVNGSLNDDDSILEFDVLLVDLKEENPVKKLGRARYYNQNAGQPEGDLQYSCAVQSEYVADGPHIVCPPGVNTSEEFTLEFDLGREESANYEFDWFISNGYGFVVDGEFTDAPTLIGTGSGFLEVTLILHDLGTDDTEAFKLFTCQVPVGDVLDDVDDVYAGEGEVGEVGLECTRNMTVGLPGFFYAFGPNIDDGSAIFTDWFVFGTPNFFINAPVGTGTDITFFQPGRFDVAFRTVNADGSERHYSCEVFVEGELLDECPAEFYGDGICDSFCLKPDPDCGATGQYDLCAEFGYYGDGFCDNYCLQPDPDCGGAFFDPCAEFGWYGDGFCDLCPYPDPDCGEPCGMLDGECDDDCPYPDPDCDTFYDFCEAEGLYGDGVCDTCPYPDPDCGFQDYCEQFGMYNNGVCDFCPKPDPDCDDFDVCAEYGYYGDGYCDPFCLEPDPDCEGIEDICASNGLYGNGYCDDFCPEPDPDCGGEPVDYCDANGYYGDGYCDDFCPEPDPDCSGGTDEDPCAVNGWYDDGVCDEDCLEPDPDCEELIEFCDDTCATSNDGVCDDGGDGSMTSTCDWGSDCSDCGIRS